MRHIFTTNPAWTFHNPVHIRFGRGCRQSVLDDLAGRQCLVVTTGRGRRQLTDDPILRRLADNKKTEWVDTVQANPGITELQGEINRLRNSSFDAIVGFGGGSAIDSAKVLAVALSEGLAETSLWESLTDPALHREAVTKPLYAVPTTAGTGSEVTPFSTVWDHEHKKKYSLAGPAVFPHMAAVDPALTDTAPEEVTLSTGLDAINQAAESIWNKNATPITMELAARAVQLGFDALPRLVEQGSSQADRDAMAECSLLAGLAISQTRTALCHSISYPITAHFGVPHGLACAFTMVPVLELNMRVDYGRLTAFAGMAGFSERDTLHNAMSDLVDQLKVRNRVRAMVGSRDALFSMMDEMITPGRTDNNLAAVDTQTIEHILERAWE